MNSSKAPAAHRSWWIAAAIVLVLVVLLRLALRPQVVASLVLDRVGSALNLEITASGLGEYRLRGTPMLVVRNVVVREPGAAMPLLRADRILLSLPWSTIRGDGGSELKVNRVELDRPIIHLDALQHWLERRPPGKTRIPTLTDGLQVRDGSVIAADWTLTGITLDLPKLHPKQRVTARIAARYRNGSLLLPFAVDTFLSQPATDAALGVAGQVGIEHGGWRIPAQAVLSGMLHVGDGWQLQHAKLAADARYQSAQADVPFALGMAGTLRYANANLRFAPANVVVHGSGPIPDLDARGGVAIANVLELQFAGSLPTWPGAWPALPPPMGQSHSAIPFALQYIGRSDLSDIAILQLRRDAARFDGRFHPAAVTAWIDAATTDSPLPPLGGRITTPRLDIAGAHLQGVEITLDDPDVQGTPIGQ